MPVRTDERPWGPPRGHQSTDQGPGSAPHISATESNTTRALERKYTGIVAVVVDTSGDAEYIGTEEPGGTAGRLLSGDSLPCCSKGWVAGQ